MSFLKFLRGLFSPQTKVVSVPLDEATIRTNTQVKALAYENTELKSSNAKKDKVIAQFRERTKDINEEENVKVVLDKQKKQLKLQSAGRVFSMKSFWAKYFRDAKFRKKIGIYSFDRKTKLAGFGDLAIAENGDFVLLDQDYNQLMRSQNLKDLFQSVGALSTDISRGVLPIWLDKDGGYVENIMEYEAPELISTGSKLRFAKARKRPVYEIITDLSNTIGEQQQDLAESEMMNTQLQNKVDELESQLRVHSNMAETSRAELTTNEERLVGIDKVFRNTERDMIKFQNLVSIQEDENSKMKVINQALVDEAERQGVKLSDEKALELVERIRSTIVNEMPDPQTVSQSPATAQQPTG